MPFDRFDFHLNAYNEEMSRKDSFLSNISIPIGVIVVIVGGLIYIADQFNYNCSDTNMMKAFVVLYVMTFGYLLLILRVIYKAIFGYKYKAINDSDVIESDYNDFAAYYSDKSVRDEEFGNQILTKIIECNSTNSINNDLRYFYMWSLIRHTLILTCILIVLYAFALYSKAQP